MVTIDYFQKLTRLLELYLLKQSNGNLPIVGYKLIALIPVDPNSWVDRQTLLLSLPSLFDKSKREITRDLFHLLKQGLLDEEYLAIYNIDFLGEDSFSVERLNDWERSRLAGLFTAPISIIGGVSTQTITIIRSSILSRLVYYQPIRVALIDGRMISGKLIANLSLTETDVELTFETNGGSQTCWFTEIADIIPE